MLRGYGEAGKWNGLPLWKCHFCPFSHTDDATVRKHVVEHHAVALTTMRNSQSATPATPTQPFRPTATPLPVGQAVAEVLNNKEA
jgi:hypothetical protein